MNKKAYVYILASKRNGTLYIWVTSNIVKRVYEHKNDLIDWFSKKYHCHVLIYYEVFEEIYEAITREKYLKWKSRKYKIELIERRNANWDDLNHEII